MGNLSVLVLRPSVTPVTPVIPVTPSMYSPGEDTDVTITCNGKSFKCHKAVVSLKSKPLAAALNGKFKEAETGIIDLDDHEPEIVECMLAYMYDSDYPEGGNSVTTAVKKPWPWPAPTEPWVFCASSATALLTHAQVYVIADKYDIQGLRDLAQERYKKFVTWNWDSDSFVRSLKVLYEETFESDRAMKDAAIKMAGRHMNKLLSRPEFAALCKENGEIALDVMKEVLEYSTWKKGFWPPNASDPDTHQCVGCGDYASPPGVVHLDCEVKGDKEAHAGCPRVCWGCADG